MKAVGYTHAGAAEVLSDLELPDPVPGPRDLLIAVKAVSVNPVDFKVRSSAEPEAKAPRILGYDAAGIVQAVGDAVSHYRVGDQVYYSGTFDRQGTNAQLHLVDERLVGRKPVHLGFAEAAALPLTTLTAWELLFDHLQVPRGGGAGKTLLVINGAGGVGSILVQLARQLTDLRVVATASREESVAWVRRMGAHVVVNHHESIPDELRAQGIDQVDYVAGLTGTQAQMAAIAEVIVPYGRVAAIDDGAMDVSPLKLKSVTMSWEMVFTRPLFQTADMARHREILNDVADLIDDKVLLHTMTQHLGSINATSLAQAHRALESGATVGKVVLQGFG